MANRRVFVIGPGAAIDGVQLGFYARSLRVDNPTSAWWHLVTEDTYIPPFVHGAIFPVGGTQVARVAFEAPPGLTQTAATAEGSATFIYEEAALPPVSGILTGNPLAAGSRSLSFTLVGASATAVIALNKPVDGFIVNPVAFALAQNQTLLFRLVMPNAAAYERYVGFRNGAGDLKLSPLVFGWVAPAGSTLIVSSGAPIGNPGWAFGVTY